MTTQTRQDELTLETLGRMLELADTAVECRMMVGIDFYTRRFALTPEKLRALIAAAKAHIEGRDAVLEEAIEAVRPFVVESPWGHTEKSNNKVCDEIIAALSALKSSQTQAPAIGGEEQTQIDWSACLQCGEGVDDCECYNGGRWPNPNAPATPPRRPAG